MSAVRDFHLFCKSIDFSDRAILLRIIIRKYISGTKYVVYVLLQYHITLVKVVISSASHQLDPEQYMQRKEKDMVRLILCMKC